jgi:DNA-binding HxlR family transcriptional regulator
MKKQKSTPCGNMRSVCPMSNVLDILGDKWTLLVVRDLLFLNKRTYSELQDSAEHIPTNILADRLKRLTQAGVVSKQPYQQNPVRYEYTLTDMGLELKPVMIEIIRWGNAHIPGTAKPPAALLNGAVKKP